MNLKIVSDFACPWCYIGKRRLKKAMEMRPDLDIGIHWLPFQLNPDMPREGMNRQDYYRAKFGEGGVQALRENLDQAGACEGIIFGYAADAVAPNTLSAHVLMHWAAAEPAIDRDALAEKLFRAHLVNCENIGDHELLARIAGETGMDGSRVREGLVSGRDEDVVKRQIGEAVAMGVSGVPFFIVNDRYGIPGAQPPETLLSVFDEVAAASDGG